MQLMIKNIQDSIARKIGSHSDLFALNDGQGPAYQSMRQQSSIDYGEQVPLLKLKDGYQPQYINSKNFCRRWISGWSIGSNSNFTSFSCRQLLSSGAVITLPIACFVVGAIGSAYRAKALNDKETKNIIKRAIQ